MTDKIPNRSGQDELNNLWPAWKNDAVDPTATPDPANDSAWKVADEADYKPLY